MRLADRAKHGSVKPWIAAVLVTVSTALAFPWTMRGLYGSITSDTPLAYLGLVPFVALAVACVLHRCPERPRGVEDREMDWIVAIALLVLCLTIGLVLPERMRLRFWDLRLDFLAVPLFVAAAVGLLLGSRSLGRLWRPIAFLFAAWPPPWELFLPRVLSGSQTATIRTLQHVAPLLSVAQPTGTSPTSFSIQHEGQRFTLNVALPCAGASATVGFLVVAVPVSWLLMGSRRKKLTWLVVGLAMSWASNVARLLVIFWAGKLWGSRVAYDIVHPYLGLVTFMLAMVASAATIPLLGLAVPARRQTQLTRHSGGPRTAVGAMSVLVVLLTTTLVAHDSNQIVEEMRVLQTPTGVPQRQPLHLSPIAAGFERYPDAGWDRFFGPGADWVRMSDDTTDGVIWIDDQVTRSWDQLQLHPPAMCLDWSGGKSNEHDVVVSPAVSAYVATYVDGNHTKWTMVAWEWVVLRDGAKAYERIILHTAPRDGAEEQMLQLARTFLDAAV